MSSTVNAAPWLKPTTITGTVTDRVFTGIEDFVYFGERFRGRIVIKLHPEKDYLFRAEYTLDSVKTGYYVGAKMDYKVE